MRKRSNPGARLGIIALIIMVNIALIFLGTQFFHAYIPQFVFVFSTILFALGILG